MEYYEPPGPKYQDRKDAGIVLASRLKDYQDENIIVVAIPNGGVPVAAEIATALQVGLSVMIVRKLQIPYNPEAGFGALTADGFLLLNHALMKRMEITQGDIAIQKEKTISSIRSRQKFFGSWADIPNLKDLKVILVDDGLASGFTMEAAVRSLKSRSASRIIIAVPTSSMSAHRRLEPLVEKIICPDLSRLRVFAVANAYENWYDLDEKEVLDILTNYSKEKERT